MGTPDFSPYCHPLSLHYALPISVTAQLGRLSLVWCPSHAHWIHLIERRFLPGRIISRYARCEGFDGCLQRVDVHADGDRADHLPGRRVDDRHGDLRLEGLGRLVHRSEEHTSELQSLMRISYAVFCLKKKNKHKSNSYHTQQDQP